MGSPPRSVNQQRGAALPRGSTVGTPTPCEVNSAHHKKNEYEGERKLSHHKATADGRS